MNPIPHPGAMPGAFPQVDGFLLILVAIGSAFVIFSLMVWTLRTATRERGRLICPIQMRPARALFRITPAGRRTDVLRCSLFGRRPITCGKVCLRDAPAA